MQPEAVVLSDMESQSTERQRLPDEGAQMLAHQTSAVIVAYNAGPLLRECVDSIRQTAPEVEVIVVDNASADAAAEDVAAAHAGVKVIKSPENVGFGAGNNLGVAQASKPFVVFLNPDTVVTEGWLEAMVGPLAADPTVGLVTPKVLLRRDPARVNVAGLNVHLSGISMCRGLGERREGLDERAEVAAISGVAFAARRDVFEAIGGFDEGIFLYMEDVDLSIRAWLAGYRCLYVPEGVVQHTYDTVEVSTRKTFWVERGRYLMLLKALWPRTLIGLLPTLFLVEVITWGWILWRNPRAMGQKLRAWGWILRHWREVARKRQCVQARRQAPDTVYLGQCRWEIDFDQLADPGMARAAGAVFGPFLWAAAQVAWLAAGLGGGKRCGSRS